MSLALNQTLQNAATSGNGVAYDTVAAAREIKLYVIWSAGVTAGEVTLEEAHDATYTGSWWPLDTPISFVADAVIPRGRSGCFRAVRARITATVVGGTVTVTLMGNKEP